MFFNMWKLNTFMLFVAVLIMEMIQGLLGSWVSTEPYTFEDLSFKLEEPMDKCENIEKHQINLTNMGFKRIKKHFIISDEVMTVNLENNDIVEIASDAFDAIPNLKCLNIRRNAANYIFNTFLRSFKHNRLKLLNLAGVRSKFIPDSFDLYSNITLNTKIGYLPSVTHLDISGNNLTNLPDYLKSLFPKLTHLYLSDNNLNPSYFYLIPKTTKHLYIERNNHSIDLTNLPKNITALFLSENVIVNPEEFQNFTKLEILSVRMCKDIQLIVHSLPTSIRELDLSWNNIENLKMRNNFNAFTNLQRLSLDNNLIHSFYLNISSLSHLSLAYNRIHMLSSQFFFGLRNVRILNLKNNQITAIFLSAFINSPVLLKLDLSYNVIYWLGRGWIANSDLQYLNMECNFVKNFNDLFISEKMISLEHIGVGNNLLMQISGDSLIGLPLNLIIHMNSQNPCECYFIEENT